MSRRITTSAGKISIEETVDSGKTASPNHYHEVEMDSDQDEKDQLGHEQRDSIPDKRMESEQGSSSGGERNAQYRRILFSTHFNIFLYATCFWIQSGTLPYLTKKLGADPVTFGYLQTTFAVVQLAGGPLFGRFGDVLGGRYAMSLAFVAAAMSYILLGLSFSMPVLFLSRLPSVFMHAMQGGQMIVTDVCEPSQRADALGKLGLSYGVGMVVGPFIGGIITKVYGEQFAAFVAAGGSILSIFFVLKFVPRQTKKPSHAKAQESGSGSIFSVKKLMTLVAAPGALFLLIIRFFAGIPIGVFQSMFQVIALETFKLAPDQNGYLMSYIGVTTMIVQGVGVGFVTKTFPESLILVASSFILIWSYLLLAYVGSVVQLCLVCLPLVVGLTTQNVVVTSALTHTVGAEDTGAILGLNMAVNSLVRTFSPTVGGFLLGRYGFPAFGFFGFFVSMLVFTVLLVRHKQK